eukprot:6032974-Lingulodinium_polyedra.AAC.1
MHAWIAVWSGYVRLRGVSPQSACTMMRTRPLRGVFCPRARVHSGGSAGRSSGPSARAGRGDF